MTPTLQIDSYGTRRWRLDGLLHRMDGPALEDADGTKKWYVHGKRHRVDGPATEYANGAKAWWVNGQRHRIDGPAVECANGDKEWWVNGQEISTPYTYVLNAAFSRGLPITSEVLPDMLEAMLEADGSQDDELNRLNVILNKYWPPHVKKILGTLFNNPDIAIKHLAFSLLGRQVLPANAQGNARL